MLNVVFHQKIQTVVTLSNFQITISYLEIYFLQISYFQVFPYLWLDSCF